MPSRSAAMTASEMTPPERLITPPPPSASTLAGEINAATRDVHTELNKLITARIPLALPPHTDSPTLYLQGIHIFSSIYTGFEESWQQLIRDSHTLNSTEPPAIDPSDMSSIQHSRLASCLTSMIPRPLWRSSRIEADVRHLQWITRTERLPDLSASGDLVRLRRHIAAATAAKPHLLLAYAWVMYMAIFSGGRWIRSELRAAGPTFWGRTAATTAVTDPRVGEHGRDRPRPDQADDTGFTLFSFPDTPDDGADLKVSFKGHFAAADDLLTSTQRAEVVDEAHLVFSLCRELVLALDATCETPADLDRRAVRDTADGVAGPAGPKGPFRPGSWGERMQKYMPREGEVGNPTNLPGTFMTEGLGAWEAGLAILLGLVMWMGLRWAGLIGGMSVLTGGL